MFLGLDHPSSMTKNYHFHWTPSHENFWIHACQISNSHMSKCMGKPTICIGENKAADQLRRNCEADQHLSFCYTDSTIPLLSKCRISSLCDYSLVCVGPDQDPNCFVFSRTGSYLFVAVQLICYISSLEK